MIKKHPDQPLKKVRTTPQNTPKKVQIMGKSGAAIASKSAAIASKTHKMMQKKCINMQKKYSNNQ